MLFEVDLVLRVVGLAQASYACWGLRSTSCGDAILLPHVLDLLVAGLFKRPLDRQVQLFKLLAQSLVHCEKFVYFLILSLRGFRLNLDWALRGRSCARRIHASFFFLEGLAIFE